MTDKPVHLNANPDYQNLLRWDAEEEHRRETLQAAADHTLPVWPPVGPGRPDTDDPSASEGRPGLDLLFLIDVLTDFLGSDATWPELRSRIYHTLTEARYHMEKPDE